MVAAFFGVKQAGLGRKQQNGGNSPIYAVHLTTANQSKMRRAHLVSVDIGADWVESGRAGENPQPEGKEKQAGWVENGRAGENPQPEAKKSSAR